MDKSLPLPGFFPNLSAAEVERLALLGEECGEVMQVIGKILRHGYESHHPDDKKVKKTTNRDMLTKEVGDLVAAIDKLCDPRHEDISGKQVQDFRMKKHSSSRKYMHCDENR